ncbi:putative LRR receptor-like serine/threonine-protein kinase [Cinnamomum micranthum f. kanehirae]|uniref:Putative LRR receptor-like serine/threonine-protein kinase n=1 Tax=Cinnamomum micranthum f. kanehirae TaxID=337451 RepID=A0A443PKB6_9MAGN|nr:putative LRR receptor-like serine/threonine-protein kinase [Cinnamomum micranthum f. kanehirae]
MGANPSTYGDVYSYGILLLEMLTGKRPSDDMFKNNLNLHQFAKMALPERVMEIIDRQLLSHENEVIRQSEIHNKLRSIMHETLVSLVKIGVSCSNDSPRERMEMKDVVIELHKGILLMEMLTGKRPTDDIFKENQNLHQFAKMVLLEQVMKIICHQLLSEEIASIRHNENYCDMRCRMHMNLGSLVRIGVSCSIESPKERMQMNDVLIELPRVKEFYLGVGK